MRHGAAIFQVFLAAIVLASCTSEPPEWIWWRPGFTAQQFDADSTACRTDAREQAQIPTPTYIEALRKKKIERQLFVNCLYAKGYQLYRRDDLAPDDGAPDTLEV